MTDLSAPIVKTIAIAAAPADVWQVLTTPGMIPQWMSDEALTVSLEGHAGGAIVIRGLLHGIPFENHGTVRAFEPEQLFAYSYWSTLSASRLADVPENHTLVSFALAPVNQGTLLTLTLSDFAEPSIRPHANLYWGPTLQILKAVCEKNSLATHG
ncbi:SRPBCC family protein [Mesorhizobium loti]|uniref:SRPBCC family protein n=1 Tax=Rhizobium loti TaxID=381 RepID=UPI00042772B1|nr:SRPBCC domain-containing protein [Mesorhizobium loti]